MSGGEAVDVPRLHVIVNPTSAWDLDLLRATLRGGAPCVQVRMKAMTDDVRVVVAESAVRLGRSHGALVLVNDRADICVAANGDGVHGGADDLPVRYLRRVVGDGRLVGATARDVATARAHEAAGADYLGVGPVYETSSKGGLPAPLGLRVIEEVAAAVSIPVIAIAGITAERVPEVIAAGAHGVAVIGAIAGAADPVAETARFVDLLDLG